MIVRLKSRNPCFFPSLLPSGVSLCPWLVAWTVFWGISPYFAMTSAISREFMASLNSPRRVLFRGVWHVGEGGEFIEYTIPNEANGYFKFISIYGLVRSVDKTALEDLSCTINSSTTSDIMLGTTENAICVGCIDSVHYAKISLNYYLCGKSSNKIVLHFFYRNNNHENSVALHHNVGSTSNYTLNIKIAYIG